MLLRHSAINYWSANAAKRKKLSISFLSLDNEKFYLVCRAKTSYNLTRIYKIIFREVVLEIHLVLCKT